jgi:hypothetical protein
VYVFYDYVIKQRYFVNAKHLTVLCFVKYNVSLFLMFSVKFGSEIILGGSHHYNMIFSSSSENFVTACNGKLAKAIFLFNIEIDMHEKIIPFWLTYRGSLYSYNFLYELLLSPRYFYDGNKHDEFTEKDLICARKCQYFGIPFM